MRLGEIKNIINRVINENKQIVIEYEPVYGGQAQSIKNFVEIMKALEVLSEQKWNDLDYSNIQQIRKEYELKNPTILPQEKFNQLNSYISSLNSKIPIFYGMLETIVKKQDEKVINIKLPSVESFSDLSDLNGRLEKLFKKFQIDGDIKFVGFDKGTDWYEILVKGVFTFPFFIACLKVAQEFLKTKTEYYKSKKARLDYLASLKENENFSEEGFEEFKKKRMKLELEFKVKEIIDNIVGNKEDINGKTRKELENQLNKATLHLSNEIEKGLELHLSLNPPKYIREGEGKLEIKYEEIKKILPKEHRKPKQLDSPKKDKQK